VRSVTQPASPQLVIATDNLMAAGGEHVTKWRLLDDVVQRRDHVTLKSPDETTQQHGTIGHRFPRGTQIGNDVE